MTDTPLVTTRPWVELKRIIELDGNWKQDALAEGVGVSKAYISQLLTGHRPPSRSMIQRFAELLRVPCTMIEPPNPPTRWAYRLDEVAARIGLTEKDVLDLVQSRQLTPLLAGGHVLITDKALDDFFSREAESDDVSCGDAA
ncbi:helix-turn-helix domain-containing protein [Amycolatopsis thailandensis]|uniref:helix-turn-helix domain-containing protein n=1 Tax=Amycolatopsis thailandensis TaxID=589330 RepID=UPI00365FF7D4